MLLSWPPHHRPSTPLCHRPIRRRALPTVPVPSCSLNGLALPPAERPSGGSGAEARPCGGDAAQARMWGCASLPGPSTQGHRHNRTTTSAPGWVGTHHRELPLFLQSWPRSPTHVRGERAAPEMKVSTRTGPQGLGPVTRTQGRTVSLSQSVPAPGTQPRGPAGSPARGPCPTALRPQVQRQGTGRHRGRPEALSVPCLSVPRPPARRAGCRCVTPRLSGARRRGGAVSGPTTEVPRRPTRWRRGRVSCPSVRPSVLQTLPSAAVAPALPTTLPGPQAV